MYGAPTRSSSLSIAGTSVSTSAFSADRCATNSSDAICSCCSCVVVCRASVRFSSLADRVRALRDRHRRRHAARPEPAIALQLDEDRVEPALTARAPDRAARAARPASRRAPCRIASSLVLVLFASSSAPAMSRRSACSFSWNCQRAVWSAADVRACGSSDDVERRPGRRAGVTTPPTRCDSVTLYLPGTTIRTDERIAEELLELAARTVRRQLMRRRAQIPGDALEPLLDRAGDHAHRRAGGVADRQQDGRRLLVGLGPQFVGGRVADRPARLLRRLLRVDAASASAS